MKYKCSQCSTLTGWVLWHTPGEGCQDEDNCPAKLLAGTKDWSEEEASIFFTQHPPDHTNRLRQKVLSQIEAMHPKNREEALLPLLSFIHNTKYT